MKTEWDMERVKMLAFGIVVAILSIYLLTMLTGESPLDYYCAKFPMNESKGQQLDDEFCAHACGAHNVVYSKEWVKCYQ